MKIIKLLSALILSVASLGAQAVVITQTQTQTVAGQDFTFTFSGLSHDFTGNGTLTFAARGDYSLNVPVEFLAAAAEGINFGNVSYNSAHSRNSFSSDDTQWSRTFNLSHSQLVTLLANDILTVTANLSSDVNKFSALSFVRVSFDYTPVAAAAAADIPEPASLLLVGIALAGLTAARRRKQ